MVIVCAELILKSRWLVPVKNGKLSYSHDLLRVFAVILISIRPTSVI